MKNNTFNILLVYGKPISALELESRILAFQKLTNNPIYPTYDYKSYNGMPCTLVR